MIDGPLPRAGSLGLPRAGLVGAGRAEGDGDGDAAGPAGLHASDDLFLVAMVEQGCVPVLQVRTVGVLLFIGWIDGPCGVVRAFRGGVDRETARLPWGKILRLACSGDGVVPCACACAGACAPSACFPEHMTPAWACA